VTESAPLPEESVWDYPRPPRLEAVPHELVVVFNGVEIARTRAGHRVLETSHPPTYYLPQRDVRMEFLSPAQGSTLCEFKGRARYWTITVGDRRAERAAWCYPDPTPAYAAIADDLCFYAGKVDTCTVGGLPVDAQAGAFYGGWITPNIKGPFKGGPGTTGW